MPIRAPLPRVLRWVVVLLCGIVAVVGGLALRGPELVAVGAAGVLAGCMAAGIVRESPPGSRPRSTLETAASVGATTVGVLLLLAGTVALAGAAVAALAVVAGLVTVLLVRGARGRRTAARPTAERAGGGTHPVPQRPVPARDTERDGLLRPVTSLTTAELGQEWTRTTAVLAGPLDSAARQAIVGRREEALDELERRDPAGFARWLAAGPTLASDPAGFVHGGRLRGDPAADTDAA